jgi:hypothetical protein
MDDEIRKRFKQHFLEYERIGEPWREGGYQYPPPKFPPFPEECRGMTCGARTRAGTPCKRRDVYLSGRCRLHGGLSTGPKTVEGKARSARNGACVKRRSSAHAVKEIASQKAKPMRGNKK